MERLALKPLQLSLFAALSFAAVAPALANPKLPPKKHAEKRVEKPKAPVVFAPAVQVTVKNGGMLEDFADNNPWMKDFAQSNLRDGLLIRLGQVLHALPAPEQEKTWTGSLQDFVFRQLIKSKPMTIAYYKEAGLASPFAIAFPDLGATELSAFQTLLHYFANGETVTSKIAFNDESGHHEGTLPAVPAHIGTYRFGYRIVGNCLAMSREPLLAGSLAEHCKATSTPATDIAASIDLVKMATPLRGFMKKYIQTSAELQLDGVYENHSFQLQHASMPWMPNPHLGKNNSIAEALGLLPSNTLFMAALPLTSPKELTPAGVEAYLNGSAAAGTADFSTVVFAVPMKTGFETGVLLSKEHLAENLQPMSELLNENAAHPPQLKQVCGKNWALLSTSTEVYDRLAASCAGKSATLNNLRANFVNSMKAEAQARVFMNFPSMAESWIRLGWAKGNTLDTPLPDELQKTIELLKRLPQIYANGQLKENVMAFDITQGDQ